jgi:hypothetical protein
MKYDLEIRPANLEAHKDIAVEMLKKKTGLFTFILRINKSNIVDFVSMEYETYGSYKPRT